MKDTQSQRDNRGIAIDLVGVSGLRWPIVVWDRQFEKQGTTATFKVAEQASSCPVYPILKRQDERHVTMQAYDKPAFVEDIVRDCVVALQHDARVAFKVQVENHESIHNHAAFAEVEWQR